MPTFKLQSKSPSQTQMFGKKIAASLKPGDILCLYGDLGTGKTTLIKGLAQGLKVSADKVHSPTFTLMNIYDGKFPMFHFDLYRLEDIKEIENIGYEEFFYGEGVAVIEWADRLGRLKPQEYLKVELKHDGESQRLIHVTPVGKRYQKILETLK